MGGPERAIGRHLVFPESTSTMEPSGSFRIVGVASDIAYDGFVGTETRRSFDLAKSSGSRPAAADVYVPLARFSSDVRVDCGVHVRRCQGARRAAAATSCPGGPDVRATLDGHDGGRGGAGVRAVALLRDSRRGIFVRGGRGRRRRPVRVAVACRGAADRRNGGASRAWGDADADVDAAAGGAGWAPLLSGRSPDWLVRPGREPPCAVSSMTWRCSTCGHLPARSRSWSSSRSSPASSRRVAWPRSIRSAC